MKKSILMAIAMLLSVCVNAQLPYKITAPKIEIRADSLKMMGNAVVISDKAGVPFINLSGSDRTAGRVLTTDVNGVGRFASPLTYNNGLTKDGNTVSLGGAYILNQGINIYPTGGNPYDGRLNLGGGAASISSIGLNNARAEFYAAKFTPVTNAIYGGFYITNGVSQRGFQMFNITDSVPKFFDQIGKTGLRYAGKYRNNLNNRSIVDKEYIDSVATALASLSSITALQNRNINTSLGLLGGGNLTADRILSVDTTVIKSKAGSLIDYDILKTSLTTKANLVSPTFTTPALGTPSSHVATNTTGLPLTTGVTGILPIANGGTGSAGQNFVDLTTEQTVSGVKSFNSIVNANNGLTIPTTKSLILFNTSDQTTNTEELRIQTNSNIFEIGSFIKGTGATRSIRIGTSTNNVGTTLNSNRYLEFNVAPTAGTGNFFFTNNTVGASGSTVGIGGLLGGSTTTQQTLGLFQTISQTSSSGVNRCLFISPFYSGNSSVNNLLVDIGVNAAANNGGNHTSRFRITDAGVITIGATPATASTNAFDLLGRNTTGGAVVIAGKILSGTAILDFPSTATQTSSELTFTVTDVVAGDNVIINRADGGFSPNSFINAMGTGVNTVTARFHNYSSAAIDPASASFKFTVLK